MPPALVSRGCLVFQGGCECRRNTLLAARTGVSNPFISHACEADTLSKEQLAIN